MFSTLFPVRTIRDKRERMRALCLRPLNTCMVDSRHTGAFGSQIPLERCTASRRCLGRLPVAACVHTNFCSPPHDEAMPLPCYLDTLITTVCHDYYGAVPLCIATTQSRVDGRALGVAILAQGVRAD